MVAYRSLLLYQTKRINCNPFIIYYKTINRKSLNFNKKKFCFEKRLYLRESLIYILSAQFQKINNDPP